MLLGKRYLIIDQIGKGRFGKIYKGKNIRTNELVAIKMEQRDDKLKCLKNEAKIYQYIGNIVGFINMKWFGADNTNSYMVMDLLGPSLTNYKKNVLLPLPKKEIKNISIQMIQRIQILHKNGFIHRDIKPDNFLFGSERKHNILYLIDLGMCKRIFFENNMHITNKITNSIIGTPIFVSLHVHQKGQPSRRDDIESIMYIILFLIDNLKWINLLDNTEEVNNIIINLKENIINDVSINSIIIELIIYCRLLDFDECPDYQYLIDQLSKI